MLSDYKGGRTLLGYIAHTQAGKDLRRCRLGKIEKTTGGSERQAKDEKNPDSGREIDAA